MTPPHEPGTPGGPPTPDDRPPMTRREARERAAREAAAVPAPQAEAPQSEAPAADAPAAPATGDELWEALTSGTPTAQGPSSVPRTSPIPTASARHDDDPPTDDGTTGRGRAPRPPRRRRRWLTATIVTVVIVALIGGGALFAWNTFQPQVQSLIASMQPNDYTGTGTTPVDITIKNGDTGGDVAETLQRAGVVKTSDAFYTLLLHTVPAPVFQPGDYRLKREMSSKAALAALENPSNKITRTITIPEGDTEANILPALAKVTGVPLAELQAAAAKPTEYGLPAQAKNLDGFLFPATYTFNPGTSATTIIRTLVDRAQQALTQDGVPAARQWDTVVLASIVQKEAGSDADMGQVARVFTNRLADGMALQSDATVAYGAGVKTVFTTDAERADASDPYNTYAHTGLPVGPISNPGDAAIKAALNPTPGPWLYFVAVNLKTGETKFATTYAEQQANEAELQAWCTASAANEAYCH